ncbi:MAG: ABC transporter permease [Vicinamibacterales bacterium]
MVSVAITRIRQGHAPFAGLVWTLIRTDFKTRYHGTIGGFVWALLKPLTMFVVLLAVFSYVFASDPQYKLDLIIGLFVYEFFQESTKAGLLSIRAKGYLLTKARFPSWIIVVTSASNAVITFGLFSLVLVTFLAATHRAPSVTAVALYTVYQVLFFAIVAGFSLAASVLFLRYRDLNQVWEVVTHAGFFVAPIIYPIGIVPERMHAYLYAWPPTPVILFSRSVLVDGHVPSVFAHLLLLGEAAIVLGAGALIYRVRAPRVAEDL